MARPLNEIRGLILCNCEWLEGYDHGIIVDGKAYVSPAIYSLLQSDFAETMKSLVMIEVKAKDELAFWRSRIK